MMNIEEIKNLIKEADKDKAVDILETFLKQSDKFREDLLLELGIAYNRKGDSTKALNFFNQVLELNSDNTKARTYVDMINNILNFYCKDLLNP